VRIIRAQPGWGAVFRRLGELRRLPTASPWLFAVLTIVPVLLAYVVVTAITVPLPDLVALSLATQPPPAVGADRVALTFAIENRGGSAVPAAVARYYLQPGSAATVDGSPLVEQPVGALSPGQVATVSTTLVLPRSLARGSYRVVACVAAVVPVQERNVRNNCQASAPLEVIPDASR
jgi:hypothetical protein